MAVKTIKLITSDLSGDEDAQTVRFGVEGTTYEVDLTKAEHTDFIRLLAPYTEVARKVSGTARRARSTSSSANSKSDNEAIRAWARSNGHEVSDRGRISKTVQDAYAAAN